jgi:hypothetical protein
LQISARQIPVEVMPEGSILMTLTVDAETVSSEVCQKCGSVAGCSAAMKTAFGEQVSYFFLFN